MIQPAAAMTVAASPRRLSGCHLHPSADPSTVLCPSCLRDRLSFLPRSKSLSLSDSDSIPPSSAPALRRISCDSRPRTSLSHLFRSDPFPPLKSNQLGLQNDDQEDAKTIKDHIEIELQTPTYPHSSRLWPPTASVFTHKLHKWRLKPQQKHKHKHKQNKMVNHEIPIGRRRSCDVDPRISMIEEKFDEPRASWDGYMIARTIPRLAPMLSVIENSLNEDETNSVSESSSSRRRNSFDCSSSGKSSGRNRLHVEIDDFKPKPIDTKVIVTGHSDRLVSAPKSTTSLKNKVLRILGFKAKSTETREIGVANEVSSGKVLGRNSYVDTYHRSPNIAAAFDRARSVRYSASPINFENGLLRFNLAPPLPLGRKKKPERRSVLNLQSNVRGVS